MVAMVADDRKQQEANVPRKLEYVVRVWSIHDMDFMCLIATWAAMILVTAAACMWITRLTVILHGIIGCRCFYVSVYHQRYSEDMMHERQANDRHLLRTVMRSAVPRTCFTILTLERQGGKQTRKRKGALV